MLALGPGPEVQLMLQKRDPAQNKCPDPWADDGTESYLRLVIGHLLRLATVTSFGYSLLWGAHAHNAPTVPYIVRSMNVS